MNVMMGIEQAFSEPFYYCLESYCYFEMN